MHRTRKHNIVGILIDAVGYEGVIDFVVRAARGRWPQSIRRGAGATCNRP
jgi:hypothetical protein